MSGAAQRFDSSMAAWRQWQQAPWGRLRFTLAEANLLRHLDGLGDGPLRILDLAGGDGGDAVRLAARGHRVTVVDCAPGMLAAAGERAEAAGVADRVTRVRARIEELPQDIASGGWDVVLCHNVLQYADRPDTAAGMLAAAVAPLREGGVVSVMAVNRHSAPLVAAVRELDPAAALAALDRDRADGRTFGTAMLLHTAEEIASRLDGLGCPGAAHYGIRSISDYITDDERKHDPAFYADLERLELAVTDRPAYRHTARLFQLIARREPGAGPVRAG
ncbi:methyltransferase domain-containing protein [Streptomyces sp. enrichment culture]|uniref:methyltransferase domain-containing protein n=1 Tax=Streptomyces sp. enrichment culture TaxID=1795815 RepID=UPI003F5630A5